MNSKQITVVAFPTAKPGTEDALRAQLLALVDATRAEPGCVDFHVHQHAQDATRFVVYENFADQAAFDAHLNAAYTKTFFDYLSSNGASVQYEFWSMQSERPAVR